MYFLKKCAQNSPKLFYLGLAHALLALMLLLLIPNYTGEVLGINALYKPLKFATSIWIFCWTIAYFVPYFEDKIMVKRFEWLTIITMVYEQSVITVQAFRGTLSHFNDKTLFEEFLFGLMGILITALTLYVGYMAYKLKRQQNDLNPVFKASLYWSLIIFVIAGFIGGYMGSLNSHSVGGEMGGAGLPFVNWSKTIGDLRVAHFIGMHALQVLPFVSWLMIRFTGGKTTQGLFWIRLVSWGYLLFVLGTFAQALMGLPLLAA